MSSIRTILGAALLCTLIGGCRKQDQSSTAKQPPQAEASDIDPHTMELSPLTQLLPHQRTHLAVDSQGNVYWVQETSEGHDILFVAGHDDIPQPTLLSSDACIAAFGPAPPPRPQLSSDGQALPTTAPDQGSGNIQSIAIDADDNVLFFFNGGIGRSIRVCVGRFNPHDQSIHILAGTQALATAAGMGDSIALSRGQIIKPIATPAGQPVPYWLWLHHSDAAGFFRIDPSQFDAAQPMELMRGFNELSDDGAPARLTSDDLEFTAGSDQPLWMIDEKTATLWRVDESGLATKWMTLIGLPRELSELTARPGGIALAFAPVGEAAVGTVSDEQVLKNAHFLKVHYPALLAITPDDVMPIVTKEDISADQSIDVASLKLQQLVPTDAKGKWVGYDAASGVLMRISLMAKR